MQIEHSNKELTLKEQQSISLDILLDVSSFCEKNNITYYLACGTLLGAVRHKGFIPWDDDVDIMMPRPDYKKFMELYHSDKYRLLKPSEGRFYYAKVYDTKTVRIEDGTDYNKNKVLGVDIDIFPLDGMVNNEKELERIYKKECFLETLLRLSNQPIFLRKNPIKCINRIIPRIMGSKNIVKWIERNAQTYDYDTSDYVIRMRWSPNGFTGMMPKEIYEKDKLSFEGHEFIVPKGYDQWLARFFGDYMKLPPIDKQKPHSCKCYWIN